MKKEKNQMSKAKETFELLITDLEKWPDGSLANAMQKDELKEVRQALDQAEKNDKVLEILKSKKVNIRYFESDLDWNGTIPESSRLKYNKEFGSDEEHENSYSLTETEFNLIKEWLSND